MNNILCPFCTCSLPILSLQRHLKAFPGGGCVAKFGPRIETRHVVPRTALHRSPGGAAPQDDADVEAEAGEAEEDTAPTVESLNELLFSFATLSQKNRGMNDTDRLKLMKFAMEISNVSKSPAQTEHSDAACGLHCPSANAL